MNRRIGRVLDFCFIAIALLATLSARADIKGAISGIVTDPQGAVVVGATVSATNENTNIGASTVTDKKGFYSFPTLGIGAYTLELRTKDYSSFRETHIAVDANSSIRVDVKLTLATVTAEVRVESNPLQIETQNTQMGEVIEADRIQAVPLTSRSFLDLLALQPGVSPYSVTAFNTGTGIGGKTVSGSLSNGSQSVNGGRSGSNAYLVNGAFAEEGAHEAAALVPNLDSIAEFRIITNNYNAEYGNFSGGQINVVTKQGTNQVHGDVFEFLRNTNLNATNYYAKSVSPYHQNIFGGTLGAPLIRDKIFGFVDYQGTRQTIATTKTTNVPLAAQHTGDFSAYAASLGGNGKGVGGSGTAQGAWAQALSKRLGYTVTQGEPYFATGCTTTSQCVFPGGIIPTQAVDSVSKNLVGFIPNPTSGTQFTTSAYANTLADDKGAARVDANTRLGDVFVYYFRDHFNGVTPFFRHTNLPGFSSGSTGFTQLVDFGLTTPLNNTLVNDLRVAYLRVSGTLGQPVGGVAQGQIGKLGFNTSQNATGGLAPIEPSYEGVPVVALKSANFGTTNSTIREANNTVQILDNVVKTIGTHSIQFGIDFHYDQINERNTSCPNGCFTFNARETGNDFADFLLGAPSAFSQAGLTQLNSRSHYFGAYLQDGWRAKPTITINYGLRWDISQPWYDTKNMLSTFVPNEQSKLFPNAPKGMVFPGDPGIPNTIAPTRYNNFAPRIGIAYAPTSSNYSVRVGFGVFYSAIQQVTGMNTAGGPPFNVYYGSPVQPNLDSPYTDRYSGAFEGLRFPAPLPPANVSAANPDLIDFTQFEQISGSYGIFPNNVLPLTTNYDLSFQRQLGRATVLSVNYVGTSGRHQMTSIDSNPGNQALCLLLSNPANVSAASPTCGPGGEDQQYIKADGTVIDGTRTVFGTLALGSNPWMKTAAGSSYNSLQTSLKHRDRYTNFLIGYTWSKSMDNSSDAFDSSDPYVPSRSRALSVHDVPHNFVASYTVRLPFERFAHGGDVVKRVTEGWSIAGITSLVSGPPVFLSESGYDQSLAGDFNALADSPSYANNGSKLFVGGTATSKNPRTRLPYFNPQFFALPALGTMGNAMRRSFHGPGVNNTDVSLAKDTTLHESVKLEFRFEAYNVFNHAQFDGVDGEFDDANLDGNNNVIPGGSFGQNLVARNPRLMQFALKLLF